MRVSIVTRANLRGEVVSRVLSTNFELTGQAWRERDTYTAIQFIGAQDVAKVDKERVLGPVTVTSSDLFANSSGADTT